MSLMSDKNDRYTIQSIEKSLDLIELLAERGSLSLMELTELLQQPKSSVYRMILTLENRGYISRSEEDGKYCLGYKQLYITRNMLEKNNLRKAALPEMKKLSELYGDTVNLGVLIGGEVMYVEIIEGSNALRMTDSVGSKAPFHATAMGKAIAAFLPESQVTALIEEHGLEARTPYTIADPDTLRKQLQWIRQHGYAVDDQEIVEGARCVAAPVFGMFGHIHGAISISGAMHRYDKDSIPEIAEQTMKAAAAASARMGHFESGSVK